MDVGVLGECCRCACVEKFKFENVSCVLRLWDECKHTNGSSIVSWHSGCYQPFLVFHDQHSSHWAGSRPSRLQKPSYSTVHAPSAI